MLNFLSFPVKSFLNFIFPNFCLNCQKKLNLFNSVLFFEKEKFFLNHLCNDCFSLIDILTCQYCPFCSYPKIVFDGKTCYSCRRKGKKLNGLFSATSYKNFIIKKIISQFKYPPHIKELAKTFGLLIKQHFQLLEIDKKNFSDFILIPTPLFKKKLKQRGFNQAEEIAKELSLLFNLGLENDILLKIKNTPAQVNLLEKQREENVKNVFYCQNPQKIKNKKIFLIDDVFTTGATMEECARVLKEAGAKQIWGITIARE